MRVLILSPHRDDAAFSCGLLAASLLRRGAAITVANVCTTSDYAPYLPADENTRFVQVTAERAAEDERFFTALAKHAGVDRAQISEVNLGWSDAPLWLSMPTDAVLSQDVSRNEVDALAGVFQKLPAAEIVIAPLALGGHLDHRMVRDAAVQAFSKELCFYEDLPYAARMSAAESDAAITWFASDLQPWKSPHPEPAGTKHKLAMHYPSQIAPEVADEMERYAQERGGREVLHLCEPMKRLLSQWSGSAQ